MKKASHGLKVFVGVETAVFLLILAILCPEIVAGDFPSVLVDKRKQPCPEIKTREETSIIVIHHSDTNTGNVEIFRRYHEEENGWDDIGYHFVITNGNGGFDGRIEMGRSLEKQGAHAKRRNYNSVGICLVGKNEFTKKQKCSLVLLTAVLCRFYNIEPSEKTIQGHHEKCPGSGLDLSDIIRRVRQALN